MNHDPQITGYSCRECGEPVLARIAQARASETTRENVQVRCENGCLSARGPLVEVAAFAAAVVELIESTGLGERIVEDLPVEERCAVCGFFTDGTRNCGEPDCPIPR